MHCYKVQGTSKLNLETVRTHILGIAGCMKTTVGVSEKSWIQFLA